MNPGHAVGWDLDPRLVLVVVENRLHLQALAGRGRPDVVEYGFVRVQRSSCPVPADLTEEQVLDRIPLRGSRRIVAHRDRDVEAVADLLLQLQLPRPDAGAIAAAVVREYEQAVSLWIAHPSRARPPGRDGVDREPGRVMGYYLRPN